MNKIVKFFEKTWKSLFPGKSEIKMVDTPVINTQEQSSITNELSLTHEEVKPVLQESKYLAEEILFVPAIPIEKEETKTVVEIVKNNNKKKITTKKSVIKKVATKKMAEKKITKKKK